MLSRDEVEAFRSKIQWMPEARPLIDALCDQAIGALDTERDAALGRATRVVLSEVNADAGVLTAWAYQADATSRSRPAKLYRAIAAQLREEQKGAPCVDRWMREHVDSERGE